MQIPRNPRPATGSTRDIPTATIPDIRTYRAVYRAVGTEIQRSTVSGGWTTVAVADDPDWSASIVAAMTWLENSPVFSEAG